MGWRNQAPPSSPSPHGAFLRHCALRPAVANRRRPGPIWALRHPPPIRAPALCSLQSGLRCRAVSTAIGNVVKWTFVVEAHEETAPATRRPTDPERSQSYPMTELTQVELEWVKGRTENWIRFGRTAGQRIIDSQRRVVSFAPGSIFAFI